MKCIPLCFLEYVNDIFYEECSIVKVAGILNKKDNLKDYNTRELNIDWKE